MSRKRRSSRKGKSNVVKVDFTGVKAGGRVPEGDYAAKIQKAEIKTSQDKNPYISFVFEITEGKHAGKILYHNTSLQAHALFSLRNLLGAIEYPVTDGAMDLDLDELIGMELGVAVEMEKYDGKERSRVVDVFSVDELGEEDDSDNEDEEEYDEEDEDDSEDDSDDDDEDSDDDEDDEDSDDDEDEDDEDDEDDEEYEEYTKEDLEDMDDEELVDAAEEYEVKPSYSGKGKARKVNRKKTIKKILDAIEEDYDEDED